MSELIREINLDKSLVTFRGRPLLEAITKRAQSRPRIDGIAIAGQVGAGKTQIADRVAALLGPQNTQRIWIDNSIREVKARNPEGFSGSLHGADQFEYFSTVQYYQDVLSAMESNPDKLPIFEVIFGERDEGTSTIMMLEGRSRKHILVAGIVADQETLDHEASFRAAMRETEPEQVAEILEKYRKRIAGGYDPRDLEIAIRIKTVVSEMAKPETIGKNSDEVFTQTAAHLSGIRNRENLIKFSRTNHMPGRYRQERRLYLQQRVRGAHLKEYLSILKDTGCEVRPSWNVYDPEGWTVVDIERSDKAA